MRIVAGFLETGNEKPEVAASGLGEDKLKLTLSFISSDIIAKLDFDMSMVPLVALGVGVLFRVVVLVKRKHP